MSGRRREAALTLADVAREAGVSEITVSRVIRAKGPIAADTRRRVESAIRKMGYVPNRVAGALASATSDLVGVIIPSLTNIVFPDVLRGVNEVISKHGYRAVVGVTDYREDVESELVGALLAWRPAALIVTGCEHSDETRAMLRGAGITIVEIMDLGGAPIDIQVGMRHEAAGAETAAYLIKRGYRRIGYIGHDLTRDLRARKRYGAFTQTLCEAGAPLAGEIVTPRPSSVEAGRDALAALLALKATRCDAVYFSNDDMAIGGVFHCMARGIRTPSDLAIVGYNGLGMGQCLPQPLTTVGTKRFEIGVAAGQAVVDRLSGRSVAAVIDVGFELITGATA